MHSLQDTENQTLKSNYWGRLKSGHIIGIVDSYGAVHSEFTGDKVSFHAEHFQQSQCQWRWSHSNSIWWISFEHQPNDEQYDSIMNHLKRKYGIEWWDNGHHDIDFLQKKWKKEEKQNNKKKESL